jgi:hypothetical protein
VAERKLEEARAEWPEVPRPERNPVSLRRCSPLIRESRPQPKASDKILGRKGTDKENLGDASRIGDE